MNHGYILSGSFLADMAHLALTDLNELKWPVGRSTLYRMAYQSGIPSTTKLVKFLDAFAATGINPAAPKHDTAYPLWQQVGDAINSFFASSRPRMGPDPIKTELMDRWVPVILAKPELQDQIIYPLQHVYPTYEELHEMGAWDRSVSPYDLLKAANPKVVVEFSKFLLKRYTQKYKEQEHYTPLMGLYSARTSHTTMSTMKNQRIATNFTPGHEMAKVASVVASLALGASSNIEWEYSLAHDKARKLPDELYQFGQFDIASLQQDFASRLLSGPFPCTVKSTFTPELKRRYDEFKKYVTTFTPAFGEVDEIMLNDLFCYSIASEITLKWTGGQLLALSVYFHVPIHCLLLWLMEASVIYRRRFASDNTIMSVKQNICNVTNISPSVYDDAFFRRYMDFTKTLSSSKASRYSEMKRVADKLTGIDHTKLERGEIPVEELSAFYEMIIGAPNNYATNPLSDREIKRIENRNDPEVVRPSDLHGYDPDEDDDEPAVSLLDALASSEDDEDEGFFIPQTPEGERFRLPSKEEYKPFWEKDEEPQSSSPSDSLSPSTSQSDNVTEDEK
jgi:hypothetical protein